MLRVFQWRTDLALYPLIESTITSLSSSICSSPKPEEHTENHDIRSSSEHPNTWRLNTHPTEGGRPLRKTQCSSLSWWTPAKGWVETSDTACKRSQKHVWGSQGPKSSRGLREAAILRRPECSEEPDRTRRQSLKKTKTFHIHAHFRTKRY